MHVSWKTALKQRVSIFRLESDFVVILFLFQYNCTRKFRAKLKLCSLFSPVNLTQLRKHFSPFLRSHGVLVQARRSAGL